VVPPLTHLYLQNMLIRTGNTSKYRLTSKPTLYPMELARLNWLQSHVLYLLSRTILLNPVNHPGSCRSLSRGFEHPSGKYPCLCNKRPPCPSSDKKRILARHGRVDDQIIHSNGEKVCPLSPGESFLMLESLPLRQPRTIRWVT